MPLFSPNGGVKSSIPSLMMAGQLKFGKGNANNLQQGFHSSFPNLSGHAGFNGGGGAITSVGFKNRDNGTFESKRSFKRGRFVVSLFNQIFR